MNNTYNNSNTSSANKISVQDNMKKFLQSQNVGSEIQYRCPKCRSCHDCKNCDEELSIREEVEQDLIVQSVDVNTKEHIVSVTLPLLSDPEVKLSPNRNVAEKVYSQQLKKIKNDAADKESIINSERKLQDLGFVTYVKDLTKEMQQSLAMQSVQNFIPWACGMET